MIKAAGLGAVVWWRWMLLASGVMVALGGVAYWDATRDTTMTFLDTHGAVCLSIPLKGGRMPVYTCHEFWERYGNSCRPPVTDDHRFRY